MINYCVNWFVDVLTTHDTLINELWFLKIQAMDVPEVFKMIFDLIILMHNENNRLDLDSAKEM